ncbi:MAG: diaminopropionate ammonia-lyase [Hyphomicrobiaceae bacterium]
MSIEHFAARHLVNAAARRAPYDGRLEAYLAPETFREARDEITTWTGYRPTPLVDLPGLAGTLGLAQIVAKDEGQRFGLMSFKALGGAYAVLRALQDHVVAAGRPKPSAAQLIAGANRDLVGSVTVAAATDGNHGRSVAWGAGLFGCRSKIYLHSHVSAEREQAIAAYGAEIVRVAGGYDDSVRQCADDCASRGWVLVADTNAGGGSPRIPTLVMQGYTVMVDEMLSQLRQVRPTHVFVQGGVGGLAAAVAGHLWYSFGAERPTVVVVEPTKADCIYRSIAAGTPTSVPGDVDTFMACLAAGEISPLAWPFLSHAVDHVLTLPEEAAPAAMRLLARGIDGDPPIVAGESGCAAIAGLLSAASSETQRRAIGLDATSRVAAIVSEGATDPATYARVVGRPAEEVAQS